MIKYKQIVYVHIIENVKCKEYILCLHTNVHNKWQLNGLFTNINNN